MTDVTGVSRQRIRTAIALISREMLASDVPRADILGDEDPADILQAMEPIAAGLMAIAFRGREQVALEQFALLFAADS